MQCFQLKVSERIKNVLEDYGFEENLLDVRMKDFVDSLEREEIRLRLEDEGIVFPKELDEDITVGEFIEICEGE